MPLFSLVILLFKEIAATSKPYFCGRDVVGLLFLQPTETGLGYDQITGRIKRPLRVGRKGFNMAASL